MTDSNTGRIPRAPSTGGADRRRLTPIDIQQKEFRLAKFRGYNEREVDEFLDQVTDEVARLHADNKRLREELEARGTVRLDTGAVNEADDVVRRARDEAARIVGEAEADVARLRRDDASDAGGPTPGPAPVAPEDFLARERRFLQSMANLIQGHASAIKDELRRHREAARTGDTGSPDGGEADEPAADDEEGPGDATPAAEAGPPTQAWSPPFVDEPGSGGAPFEGAGEGEAGASHGPAPQAVTTERVEEGGRTHTSVMEEGGEGWAPGSTTPAKVWVGEERLLLPSIAEMPAPPVRGGDVDAAPAAPGDTTERTLRELFWGED